MSKRSNKRPDPMVIVALIGLAGTIIAALLASPIVERWLSPIPSSETSSPSPSSSSANPTASSTKTPGDRISLNQTVHGTLYFNDAGVWIFSEGPATVSMILDVGPFGGALIIVRDPSGVERAYADQQIRPGVAVLANFFIPTDGDYKILVRNAANEPADYTLIVQDALTPVP